MAASSHDKSRPISISVMDYIPMSGWEGTFFSCALAGRKLKLVLMRIRTNPCIS